jgi:hypothetical protein
MSPAGCEFGSCASLAIAGKDVAYRSAKGIIGGNLSEDAGMEDVYIRCHFVYLHIILLMDYDT